MTQAQELPELNLPQRLELKSRHRSDGRMSSLLKPRQATAGKDIPSLWQCHWGPRPAQLRAETGRTAGQGLAALPACRRWGGIAEHVAAVPGGGGMGAPAVLWGVQGVLSEQMGQAAFLSAPGTATR